MTRLERNSNEATRKADSRELPFEYVSPTSTGRLLKRESTHEHPRVDALKDKANEERVVRGHVMSAADIFKLGGLIAFFVVIGVLCVAIWPYISDIFEEGGVERVMNRVQSAGSLGVVFLLIIEFLQVVVAFIPGEVVQIAAGMLYGPWAGALVVLIGCVISSAFVFVVVHKLGAPFVQGMVPTKYLDKFRKFEASGKLNMVVFVLFLIPGLPKDVFTYLVPLTDMRMRTFLLISNIGRIPGVVVSTYAAAGIIEGDYVQSAVIFAVTAGIAVLGILGYGRLMKFLEVRAGVPADEVTVEKLDPEDYETRTEILEIVSGEIASASSSVSSVSAAPAMASAPACARSHNPRERRDSLRSHTNNPRERTRESRRDADDSHPRTNNPRSHAHNPRIHSRNSQVHGK